MNTPSTPRRVDPTERERSHRDEPAPSPKHPRDVRGRSPDTTPEPDAPRDPRTEPRSLSFGAGGAHDGLSPLGPNERDDDDEDR